MDHSNPWLSVWTQPRSTVARVVQENPKHHFWILASLYGFSSMMDLLQSMALGDSLGLIAIFLLALFFAPLYGYLQFSIASWAVLWTGKLFKGAGNFLSIRAAYAWSSVPTALNVPLWLLMAAIFGHQLFMNLPSTDLISGGKVFTLYIVLLAKFILGVWSLVILVNAVSEVQKVSILKSIINLILAALFFLAVLFILWNVVNFIINILNS